MKTNLQLMAPVILLMALIGCGGSDTPPADSNTAIHKLPDTGQTQSFTNTFGEDHDYLISSPSFTQKDPNMITDRITGLVWQQEDDGTQRSWANAKSYCAGLNLSNFSDWRLPTRKELVSILDLGTFDPAINISSFPTTTASRYWSNTSHALYADLAWSIDFGKGGVYADSQSSGRYVRCVRSEYMNFDNFIDNGNGTVSSLNTGLIWQQSDGGSKDWEQAIDYCENLSLGGYADWRLPNYKELESITDESRYDPAINTNYFPTTVSSSYWSSTTLVSGPTIAWFVNFGNDEVNYYYKTTSYNVRCIRGGK